MEGRCDAGLRCSITDWSPGMYKVVGTCKPGKLKSVSKGVFYLSEVASQTGCSNPKE